MHEIHTYIWKEKEGHEVVIVGFAFALPSMHSWDEMIDLTT